MNPGNKNKDIYRVTGVMSGTSLDGVDIAFCNFIFEDGKWAYSIGVAETIPYPGTWKTRLANLENESALVFVMTDAEYGNFLGGLVREFHRKHNLQPDFIASHGHTIFHQPASHYTSQVGNGSCIAAVAGLPVVCDFRSTDVALGGQGAPLVPVGDQMLFEKYTFCLNLGGFANISYNKSGERIAFDICPANIVLNYLSLFLHKDYDENGMLARNGTLHPSLLKELNSLAYYRRDPPKSLGKEWVISEVHPLLEKFDIPVEDKLQTCVEHIAEQVSLVLKNIVDGTLLLTGGGTFNDFLTERIREKTRLKVVIPDLLTINFKEALIFAFLGVLRWRGEVNCLKSVTGARQDNSGGAIYLVEH